jgi:CelD/BcsL family acetyltransferase involved in cellulose biosynthesis
VTTVDDLPEDALHLLAHAEELSAECGPDWYRNLCANVKFLGDAAQFHVLRRDRVAVAVLPVVCRADFLMGHHRVESLANFYTAIFAPAFAEDLKAADLVPLIRSVLASCIRTASLRFAPLDPTSREFTLLRDALVAAGLFVFPYFYFGNWYLKQGSDWAGYLAGRAGDLRSTVRRMGQRFESESGRLEIVTGPERLAAGIAAFEKCYASSWKGSEPYASFVPGLIETCARRGWLRLGVAWLKEEPIAAQFWIVANGKAEIYKLAYDKKFKRYSPGTLLTAHLLKHVLERDKVSEVDYLVGDERYKQAWMSHRRERWGLVAYNAGTVGGLIGLGGAVLRRLTRALTTPWRTARSGR